MKKTINKKLSILMAMMMNLMPKTRAKRETSNGKSLPKKAQKSTRRVKD